MVSVGKGIRPRRTVLLALLLFGLVLPPGPASAEGHAPFQAYETIAPGGRAAGFGESVAWHDDTVVVGGYRDDVVQVLALRQGLWTPIQTLKGQQHGNFGQTVAVDGNLLVVGAPYEDGVTDDGTRYDGSAYVYRHDGNGWGLLDVVHGPRDAVAFASALDVRDDWVVIGTPDSYLSSNDLFTEGSVYLFQVGAGSVTLKQTVRESDVLQQRMFGFDVSLGDGILAVGAPGFITEDDLVNPGAVFVYTRSGNTWSEQEVLEDGGLNGDGGFGRGIEVVGDQLAVCDTPEFYISDGSDDEHANLFVFARNGGSWSEVQRTAEVACYAVESDGQHLVTAGYDRPDLRVWRRSGERWIDDIFGHDRMDTDAIAVADGRVALGYPSTYGGRVTLVGPNESPVALAESGEAPIDLDGDGMEVVVLDGSGSTDDGELEHHWYRIVQDEDDVYLGSGETLTVNLPVGDHVVRLAVADADLGTDQVLVPAAVLPPPPPEVGFSWLPKDASSLEPMRFVDESTSEYGHVTSWDWDFDGDGEADASGPTPSWTFEEPGLHRVTLTVGTDVNTEASLTQKVRVRNLLPEARAGMDEILEDTDGDGKVRVQLDGTGSEDADGEVESYRWVRDGRTVSSSAKTSLDLGPGVHDIDLTVTDDHGGRDKDRVTFLILEQGHNNTVNGSPPTARYDFAPHPGPPARAMQFTDDSSDPDGRVIMWWYDVGDDGSWDYTEPDPLVGFDAYGAHDVRLRVTDEDGQQNDYTQNVFLRNGAPTAVIEARATTAFVGQQVVFVDNSTDPESGPLDRVWDFGDGATGSEQAPSHVYTAAGTYTVTLTVTDEGDKSDDASIEVTVQEVPPGVTVPAVAGSPHKPQAIDSPFAHDDALVDTDGDGEGDTPLEEVLSEDTGTSAKGDTADRDGSDGPSPPAYVDPSKPWLWVLLGALLVALVGSAWAAFRA